MKEKIEKLLKSHLKRKLTITTATLIAFLLSSNLAMAKQNYKVGNGKIERDISEALDFSTLEDATDNLKKTGLFSERNIFRKIGGKNRLVVNIVNRLKDKSNFTLLSEVNKPFINEGLIWDLTNNGRRKIENKGRIWNLNSATENEIENRGYIEDVRSVGNISNKGYIYWLLKAKDIVNDGYILSLFKSQEIKNNITNNGYILEIIKGSYATKDKYINNIEKIVNNGIIYRVNYISDLKNSGKITNKGIVIDDLSNFTASATDENTGRAIKNYVDTSHYSYVNITDTSIANKILNAYLGKIENNLKVENNSILNMYGGEIAANTKISIDNSTVNMIKVGYNDGLELEFKNNSKIGYLNLRAYRVIKSLTMDNTTEVGSIEIVGNIKAINLVPNESDRSRVLRINRFGTEGDKNVNTFISTNVDLLGGSDLGNITVEDKGRLTIAKDALSSNGRYENNYYKKDITIKDNGKIIIGIDPYNIGQTEKLGDGNNLTESVIGQVDTTDPNLRKPQSELNLLADSRLHGIVVLGARKLKYQKYENNSWIEYEADVRNEYKVVEELNLPKPEEPKPEEPEPEEPKPEEPKPEEPKPEEPKPEEPKPEEPKPEEPKPEEPKPEEPKPEEPKPEEPKPEEPKPEEPKPEEPKPEEPKPEEPKPEEPKPEEPKPEEPKPEEPKPTSEPTKYTELNSVYQDLQKAGGVKYLKVGNDEQVFGLYEYLRDMYANSPYALSGETSFRNLAMLRDNAYLDLKPNLNKWAVMGGLSHSDRENKFKHELGTTEADTITTGAYAKGEYGLKEDTTLGLILGGTNSKSDLLTGKVKGSSIYLGAYAKKYINNFKFTLGTGIDLGEYKVDRNAIGYAGIIETEKYSAKQKNRAFDLYAEARYSKDLGNNFYLEPNFNLAYSRVRQGGATENDGKINLDIKSKTFNQTTAALGLDLKKVLLNGNTSHSFALGTAYERVLSGATENSLRASFVGGSGSGFDILVPEKEKGRTSIGAEYKLENKVGILFNLKMDYGFKHGSDKKDIRFSTGLGYKF